MWIDILGFDRTLPYLLAAFAAAYVIGALPMGLGVARLFGAADPRSVGSGNIGATNVMRAGGWRAGALTLALDVAKGFAPTYLAWEYMGPLGAGAAGFGALMGHCFSVFLGFWGGKGIATGLGVLLAWRWETALVGLLVWALTLVAARYVSAASMAALAAALAAVLVYEEWDYAPYALAMGAVVFLRHLGNLGRLFRGEEPRVRWPARRES